MNSVAEIEIVLQAAYEAKADCYTQALALIEKSNPPLGGELAAEPALPKILSLLEQVSDIELQNAEAKKTWLEAGGVPGFAFQVTIDRVRLLIELLQDHILDAMAKEQERKDRLLPALDALARGRKMQQAYAFVQKKLA
jgi:hypothetical protein